MLLSREKKKSEMTPQVLKGEPPRRPAKEKLTETTLYSAGRGGGRVGAQGGEKLEAVGRGENSSG